MFKPENLLEIKIKKHNIRPEDVTARDLADMLCHVEKSVAAIAQRDGSELTQGGVGFALVAIRRGSAAYQCLPVAPEITVPAFEEFAQKVNDPESLPRHARSGAVEVNKFSAKYGSVIELRSRASDKRPIGIVRPKRVEPAPFISTFTGETSVYGIVESVGGTEPKAWIRLDKGDRIGFDINRDQAKALGARLYDRVGLRGVATWDSKSRQVVGFSIIELLPYVETPISEAFRKLREEFGEFFDQIEDVDKFVSDQRRG